MPPADHRQTSTAGDRRDNRRLQRAVRSAAGGRVAASLELEMDWSPPWRGRREQAPACGPPSSRALRRPTALIAVLLTMSVIALGLLCVPALAAVASQSPPRVRAHAATSASGPLAGRGMWIWYVNRSEGGSVAAIAARARAAGVQTVYVKSADGVNLWSQFNSTLVGTLHRAGLHVCAWQYVYGTQPLGEASAAARAVRAGADCVIVDAEAEYEGRYGSAQVYLRALRAAAGARYPLALASFPYVDYHPSLPYSVFLGPGGAQYDMPQMYWRDIATSVTGVFRHTYTLNRIYRRTIVPLGQTYAGASAAEVEQFRALAVRYQAPGISWWDFAWTSAGNLWGAVGGAVPSVSAVAPLGYPLLGPGSAGDEVLWLQEHLARGYPAQRLTGLFGAQTAGYLRALQARRHLPVSGATDAGTWQALLRLRPAPVSWTAGARTAQVRRTTRRASAAPASAALPARRYEIPELGAARPGARAGVAEPSGP